MKKVTPKQWFDEAEQTVEIMKNKNKINKVEKLIEDLENRQNDKIDGIKYTFECALYLEQTKYKGILKNKSIIEEYTNCNAGYGLKNKEIIKAVKNGDYEYIGALCFSLRKFEEKQKVLDSYSEKK